MKEIVSKLPLDYTVATQYQYTSEDNEQRQKVITYVLSSMPSMPEDTAFKQFASFIRCMCSPDGLNYHLRMNNDNGKCIVESLIITSLGMCRQLNSVYSNIYKCERKYFRVHKTTCPLYQPQLDQTTYRNIADVVVMAFSSDVEKIAVDYLMLDLPRTPKVLIADAEAGMSPAAITYKFGTLERQLRAYNIAGQSILGLLVGGSLVINAKLLSNGELSDYKALDSLDLTRPNDIAAAAVQLNYYLAARCSSP